MSRLFPSSSSSSQAYIPVLTHDGIKDFDDDDDLDSDFTMASSPVPQPAAGGRSRPASGQFAMSELPNTSSSFRQQQHQQSQATTAPYRDSPSPSTSDDDEGTANIGRSSIPLHARTSSSSSSSASASPSQQQHSRSNSRSSVTLTPRRGSQSSISLNNSNDTGTVTPTSPPPKYALESMGFEDSGRQMDEEMMGGGDHGAGAGTTEAPIDGLLMQASTTLVIAVSGLIGAGWLLDVIQHWPVFVDISELIILIPILLNLKGNLEMNLASRLSTASNMGLLDSPQSRSLFVKGNLALLQVQALSVGSIAGLFSFGLGMLVHPSGNNWNEIALMIAASMMCASISSFVLGGFMCVLVLLCRKFNINPDNIACPLASSMGDLVTLFVLAGCSTTLRKYVDTPICFLVLGVQILCIPVWLIIVRRNKFVVEVVKEGWGPILLAMVIASTAGLTLERYIDQYPGMALISPVLNGLAGNIGSIYASRISTSVHAGIKENHRATQRILFVVNIPIQGLFLLVIGLMGLGHIHWSAGVVIGYTAVSLILIMASLIMAKYITLWFWKWGYDPDNYALPILTSLIDVIGTGLLVLCFWAIGYRNYETVTVSV
ncbi:hypothetical protein DFQ26_004229 [Actinomortierella ambigua]|nr:hypothetical protein DFQ26_004229 [Actinomortierella ambigua]